VNGPQFVARELLALALFVILLFHWNAKTATSESRLQSPRALEKENKRSECQGVLKMPASFSRLHCLQAFLMHVAA
jgi:hypothetical protein